MRIRVLQDGPYNDADYKAKDCRAGDELETGDAYGTLLVAKGLAEELPPEPDQIGPAPESESDDELEADAQADEKAAQAEEAAAEGEAATNKDDAVAKLADAAGKRATAAAKRAKKGKGA
jgi:hypothetical protein